VLTNRYTGFILYTESKRKGNKTMKQTIVYVVRDNGNEDYVGVFTTAKKAAQEIVRIYTEELGDFDHSEEEIIKEMTERSGRPYIYVDDDFTVMTTPLD